eukprot:COSAG06_NODE_1701_length_8674_cov_30.790904_1_plen_1199_part_10
MKLLTAIGWIEFVIIAYTRPFLKMNVNFQVIGTNTTKLSQMVAPILLQLGLVEDQFTALFMMLMNAITVIQGIIKDAAAAAVPLFLMAKESAGPAITAVTKVVFSALIILGAIKKKLSKMPRPKPPPPVWKLVKMPPPILNLLNEMMPPPVMDALKAIIADANPILKAYGQTFAKVAAQWLSKEGAKVLAKQFKEVLNPKHKRKEVDITKFIDKFHTIAIMSVLQICQPKLKSVAQNVYDQAMIVAKETAKKKAAAKSGTDPIAAAAEVLSPELIGKLEALLGNFAPVIKQFITAAMAALAKWRKNGGDKQIAAARKQLEKKLKAAEKAMGGVADAKKLAKAAKKKGQDALADATEETENPLELADRTRGGDDDDLDELDGLDVPTQDELDEQELDGLDIPTGESPKKGKKGKGADAAAEAQAKADELKAKMSPEELEKMKNMLPIKVPTAKFLKKAIIAAATEFKKKLEKKGGEIGAQVALVDLDPDMKPGALRREFSKLLQVQMVALARAKMVPEISKKIDSIGLPNRVILSKVKEVVFDLAEKILRKVINERVKLTYADMLEKVKIPNCGVKIPKEEPVDEDEYGFIPAQGGSYTDLQPRFGLAPVRGGAGALQAEINKIIDPETQQAIKDALGPIIPMLKSYGEVAATAAKEWADTTGKVLIEEATAAAQKGKKPDKDMAKKLMLKIEVPTFEFHKAGMSKAIPVLTAFMEERGGAVSQFLEKMALPKDLTSLKGSDLRRAMDQLMQEFIMDKAYLEVFPMLDQKLSALGLIGPVAKKVKGFVYDQVEDKLRMLIHNQVVELYDNLSSSMQIPGCGVKREGGDGKKGFHDAQEEDEFGWIVKKGGWDKEKQLRRKSGGGPGSPLALANQVVSPEIMKQLKALAGGGGDGGDGGDDDGDDDDGLDELEGLEVPDQAPAPAPAPAGGSASPPVIIMAFVDAAVAEMEKWKNETEAEIKKAGKNKKKLLAIKVPTGKFLEAGIKAAMEVVLPLLEEIGGPVVDRAKALGIIASEGADGVMKGGLDTLDLGALKRGFSQMLQEMVMDKVQHEVFPLLDGAVMDLAADQGLPSFIAKKVKFMVFDIAEETVRGLIHGQIQTAFKKTEKKISIKGMGKASLGKEVKEDKFGFLVAAGGFTKYKKGRPSSGGIMDFVNQVLDEKTQKKLAKMGDEVAPFLTAYMKAAMAEQAKWQKADGKAA